MTFLKLELLAAAVGAFLGMLWGIAHLPHLENDEGTGLL